MSGLHAQQRARLLAAMADGPITSKDFRTAPAIDGGPEIPRVAARIGELREQGYQIPMGAKDEGQYAIYTLTSPDPVTEQLKSFGFCHGCLGALPPGEACPRRRRVEVMTYWEPFGPEFCCRLVVDQEERYAA